MRATEESDLRGNGEESVAAQAAFWLAQHQLGTIDETEFQRWRSADVAHALAFCRALAVWESAGRHEVAGDLAPLQAAFVPDAATAALPRRRFLKAAGIAAAVGLFGAGSFTTRAYAWSTAETALGENRQVSLPDGSLAWLNTDSRLSWRFSDTERTFWIEKGEVGLVLRNGPEAVIRGDERSLVLSQGRYNARLRSEALDLLVFFGSARTQMPGQGGGTARSVSAGQSLLVSHSDAIVRSASAAQISSTLAWRDGEILFQDMTLGMAVDEYNRFLARKIVIVDRDLSGIPVGGRFTSTDPTAFLHAVSTGLGIRISRAESAYLLTR